MSLSIFEVTPAATLEQRFVYTLDTATKEILPFSAVTLRLLNDLPQNCQFKPIRGVLNIKTNHDIMSIVMKKGSPYIVITDLGPTIAWWIDGKFNIPENITESYLLKIPKMLITSNEEEYLEEVPLKYPIKPVEVSQAVAPKPYSLDDPIGSPGSACISTTDLSDKVTFLTALVETYLRREYKIYNGITCPDKFPLDGRMLSTTPFETIQDMMSRGEIEKFEQNPLFQPFAGSPRTSNRFLTFYDKKGGVYIVKACYDAATNRLGPPAS